MMDPGLSTSESLLKIVVPINFSETSEMALDFALRYSRFGDCEIFVFHALPEEKGMSFSQLDRLNVECLERMKAAVMKSLERVAAAGVSHSVEQVHRRIARGKRPYLEILRVAAAVSADMIIMGSPSAKGAVKDLLLQAPCTTVLVREKDLEYVAP